MKLGTNLQVALLRPDAPAAPRRQDPHRTRGDGQEYVMINGEKRHILSYLQDFLFSADRARGPISALSGGNATAFSSRASSHPVERARDGRTYE